MHFDFTAVWERLNQPVALEFAWWQWAVIAAICLFLVVPRELWKITGLYSTLIHELGHITLALLTGRMVMGLRLGWDHSGEVVSRGRGRISAVLSGICGYPAPLWASALMFWAASTGYAGRALGVYALFFILALLFARNWPAFAVCSASAVVAVAVVALAPAAAYLYLVLLIAGFLLLAGIKDFFKLLAVHVRHRGRLGQSDAFLIAQATGTFASLWLVVITLLGAAGAWWASSSLLVLL